MSWYVALDGPDGCGKSTQATRLTAALEGDGHDVLHLREPGSTPFGERLRDALLDPGVGRLDPLSEALAFSAARREMVRGEIAPALAAGRVVVAERCFLSTLVYQCRAPIVSAAPEPLVREVTCAALSGVWPDLVIVLDVDQDAVRARVRGVRTPDRIESLGSEFHARVRAAFLELAGSASWLHDDLRRPTDASGDPLRVELIDASQSAERVHETVLSSVRRRLGAGGSAR